MSVQASRRARRIQTWPICAAFALCPSAYGNARVASGIHAAVVGRWRIVRYRPADRSGGSSQAAEHTVD
jgi:hypothetical protein